MKRCLLQIAIACCFGSPAFAQLDPGAMTGWTAGEAVQYDLQRRACEAKLGKGDKRCAQAKQSDYERWRNRPGKRDCGAYNWKCPAKPRNDGQ